MAVFTEAEKRTLTMIVDTLAPVLAAEDEANAALFRTGGIELGIPDLLEDTLERAAGDTTLEDLKRFLQSLELAPTNWVAARKWGAFSSLSLEDRTAVLRAWGNSPIGLARKAFQGVKRLTLFLFYAQVTPMNTNPVWESLHYPGPLGTQMTTPKTIQPVEINAPTRLTTDVLIIGSGAGGGVLAGELAQAGYEVLILEKGGYYDTADFDGNELTSNTKLFEKAGTLTTVDISMSVLAGSTLGGGTTINWSASLRPPDYVLREWEEEFGFTGATSPAFQASLDAVSQRMNVNSEYSPATPQNAMLERGCQALNYQVATIPRNVKGCEDCGFCNYGCLFNAKQGTLKTYLQDAYDAGAKIIVRAFVDQVTHHNGQVTGAIAQVQGEDGKSYPLSIQAKAVIVSAGSIHTPAVLLRSGLKNPNIGKHLRLHPVTSITGEYDQAIRSWVGAPMTRVVKEFENLDGRGYGHRIETPPAHPGILGASFPWQSGEQHRHIMENISRYAHFIIITRDFYSGQIKTNKRGNPLVYYDLHPYDAKHLQHGMREAIKLHHAAGAKIIYSSHNTFMQHKVNGRESLNQFIQEVDDLGLQPNNYALFSAHQMGSCRIAGSPKLGAVKPNGETYEVKNLFVADASVFPTASGVNPMLTIMGTAHFLAQQIKTQLS